MSQDSPIDLTSPPGSPDIEFVLEICPAPSPSDSETEFGKSLWETDSDDDDFFGRPSPGSPIPEPPTPQPVPDSPMEQTMEQFLEIPEEEHPLPNFTLPPDTPEFMWEYYMKFYNPLNFPID